MGVAEELSRRPLPITGPRDAGCAARAPAADHLAGELAVAIAGRMAERGQLVLAHDGAALTRAGVALLTEIGVATEALDAPCRACLDWSERRPHLAGAPATALYRHFVAQARLRPRQGQPRAGDHARRRGGIGALVRDLAVNPANSAPIAGELSAGFGYAFPL